MNSPEFPDWTRQVAKRLDESIGELDATTLSRLTWARQAAMKQVRPSRYRFSLWPAAGLLGSAGAMLLVAGLWYTQAPNRASVGRTNPVAANRTSDNIDATDSVEFYQDLDFYAWLEQQQSNEGK